MRSLQITLATAFFWNLMLGIVFAQTLQQPAGLTADFSDQAPVSLQAGPVSVRLNQDEPATPSPSDLIVRDSCDAACDGKLCGKDQCSAMTFGGWTQLGYHTQGSNGFGQGFINDYPNHFQVQQQWLYLEKDAIRGNGFDWGFRIDYVYGTDGQDVQAFGGLDWDNDWDQGGHYGHAIPQLYVELAFDDLNLKMGHFINNAGMESMPAPGNAFYSHTYAMALQPRTFTGVVGDYALSDTTSVIGGWVEGWNSGFSDAFNGNMFIGGFETQLNDVISLSYIAMFGDAGGLVGETYSHTIVLGMPLTDNLDYFLQTDLISQQLPTGGENNVVGITQYLSYAVHETLDVGVRFEWLELVEDESQFYDVTIGAQSQVRENFVVRPEVRWDCFHVQGLTNSTTFGIDAILSY